VTRIDITTAHRTDSGEAWLTRSRSLDTDTEEFHRRGAMSNLTAVD